MSAAALTTLSPGPRTSHQLSEQLLVELLYVHKNRRLVRDGSPGRPPRLSHSSWALSSAEHSKGGA